MWFGNWQGEPRFVLNGPSEPQAVCLEKSNVARLRRMVLIVNLHYLPRCLRQEPSDLFGRAFNAGTVVLFLALLLPKPGAGSFLDRFWNDAEFECTNALPRWVRYDMRCGDVWSDGAGELPSRYVWRGGRFEFHYADGMNG